MTSDPRQAREAPHPATLAKFEQDMDHFRAEFERLNAVIDLGAVGRFVDPTKVSADLMWSYDRLRQYGHTHGLRSRDTTTRGR